MFSLFRKKGKYTLFETIELKQEIMQKFKDLQCLSDFSVKGVKIIDDRMVFSLIFDEKCPLSIFEKSFDKNFSTSNSGANGLIDTGAIHFTFKFDKNLDENINKFNGDYAYVEPSKQCKNFMDRYLKAIEVIKKSKNLPNDELKKLRDETKSFIQKDYKMVEKELDFYGIFPKFTEKCEYTRDGNSFLVNQLYFGKEYIIENLIFDYDEDWMFENKKFLKEFGMLSQIFLKSISISPRGDYLFAEIEFNNFLETFNKFMKKFNKNELKIDYRDGLSVNEVKLYCLDVFLEKEDIDNKVIFKCKSFRKKEFIYKLKNIVIVYD